jgi:hypothetical protein
MYCLSNLEELSKSNKPLIFIHTPKCGGTYVASILSYLGIRNKQHSQAIPNEGIHFTVVRNPIDRFESLMNYRLSEEGPRDDWPEHLTYAYKDPTVRLNDIVEKMTDAQIVGFRPYKTLTYWTQHVDILITIEQLPDLLEYFGYKYDAQAFSKVNVSKKQRGVLNAEIRNRIGVLYHDDMILYNKVIAK